MISRRDNRIKRHKRVRAKIYGTKSRPRLSVFKSHKHIHLQLIDDEVNAKLGASQKQLKQSYISTMSILTAGVKILKLGEVDAETLRNLPDPRNLGGGRMEAVLSPTEGLLGMVAALTQLTAQHALDIAA